MPFIPKEPFDQPGHRSQVIDRLVYAARLANLPDQLLTSLEIPQHVHVHKLDNGINTARVQDNDALARWGNKMGLPYIRYKGGIRYDRGAHLGKGSQLCAEMTLKAAATAPLQVNFDDILARYPDYADWEFRLLMGGGKLVAHFDPLTAGQDIVHQVTRNIGRVYAPNLINKDGTAFDVPAPDVNTSPPLMKILLDEMREHLGGRNVWHHYTGKNPLDGGHHVREYSTALAAVLATEWLMQQDKPSGFRLEGATFAIDGFGNVGGHTARLLADRKAHVKAFSDVHGALMATPSQGYFGSEDIVRYLTLAKQETVANRLFDRNMTRSALLSSDVDCLVLASPYLTLTRENADQVRARYIAEPGNGMIDNDAYDILVSKGVKIISDTMCSAGGVIVSGIEYIQNRAWEKGKPRVALPDQLVIDLMTEQLLASLKAVYRISVEHRIPLRPAIDVLALRNLHAAHEACGLYT